MNEAGVKYHIAVTKFYFSIIKLLYECGNEHLNKAEKALEELKRYGA